MARSNVNEVIALDPFRSLPYWIRGEIYGFQGQFEYAIADFEILLTLQYSKIPRERIITSLEHWRRMQALQPASHKPVVAESLSPKPALTKPIVTEPNTAERNLQPKQFPLNLPFQNLPLLNLSLHNRHRLCQLRLSPPISPNSR